MDPAPYFNDVADGPIDGIAHWVTTSDQVRLRVAHWTGDDVQGTILLFPGRTEYIEKYGRTAGEFLSRGYASLVIDWRGQGLADRTHPNRSYGDIRQFGDYQTDVAALLAHAQDLGLPKPYFLLAHSMGGCIGLRALADGLPVKAAVFSAPMWGVGLSPILRPLAWAVSCAARLLGFEQLMSPGQTATTYVQTVDFAENSLTSDAEMFAFLQGQSYKQPELTLGGPSLRWLDEALRETRALSHLPSPNCPCLTFLGTQETIVDVARITQRMANWPNGALEVINGAKHELLIETPATRTRVFDLAAAHFAKHR